MNAAPFFAPNKFWKPEGILEFMESLIPYSGSTKRGEWSSIVGTLSKIKIQQLNGMNKAKTNELNRFYPLNMKKAMLFEMWNEIEKTSNWMEAILIKIDGMKVWRVRHNKISSGDFLWWTVLGANEVRSPTLRFFKFSWIGKRRKKDWG